MRMPGKKSIMLYSKSTNSRTPINPFLSGELQLFAECLALVKFVDVMTSEDLVVKMSNVFGLGEHQENIQKT